MRLFWRLFLGVILSCLLGVSVWLFVAAGEIYQIQDTYDGVHLKEIDAVAVLAGGRGRILQAGDIWYRYYELSQHVAPGMQRPVSPIGLPLFYVAGVGEPVTAVQITRLVRRGLEGALKPENIFVESESVDTVGNMEVLVREALKRKWTRVLLVTSQYHMKRSLWILNQVIQKAGANLEVETFSVVQEPFDSSDWRSSGYAIRITFGEFLKLKYFQHFEGAI